MLKGMIYTNRSDQPGLFQCVNEYQENDRLELSQWYFNLTPGIGRTHLKGEHKIMLESGRTNVNGLDNLA